jgi:hypothetical protein
MNGLTDSGEAGHRFIQPEPARSLAKKSDANNTFQRVFTLLRRRFPIGGGMRLQDFDAHPLDGTNLKGNAKCGRIAAEE